MVGGQIMEKILSVKNLNKSFGKKKVIDNVNFDVYAGEIFGFLGPNGSGKTTTIKMIMGFLFPDSGNISICDMNMEKDYEKAMNLVGGIVENPEMYKDMTGIQNLQMYSRLHDGVTQERIAEVVELVGMTQRANDKIKKYSLGMKQRIGVAQAIVHKPKLLILDEPTNGLDPAGIKELRDILKKLAHEEGIAVMVSSHMLAEMELMCDRVAIIDKGRIIDVKPIDELLHLFTREQVCAIEVKAEDLKKAGEIVNSMILGNMSGSEVDETVSTQVDIDEENNTIKACLGKESVPDLIRLLVNENIDIYSVKMLDNSLEEAFIEITGGGVSIA